MATATKARVVRTKFVPKEQSPRVPCQRLDSLSNPQPRFVPRQAQEASSASAAVQCTNPDCGDSDVAEDDGKLVCRSCGFVLQEVSIAQELTFGEASNGAAVVQGVFVGANDEGARNTAGGASRVTGGMDSRDITIRNGTVATNSLVGALNLTQTHKDQAMHVYRLAVNINFIQGRVTRHVAAVCLYIICRRDSENRTMLIDFADILEINVFKLGQIYSALTSELGLRFDEAGIRVINPENLIQRFAQDLEFGDDEHRIANEAVQILKRMKRDWMLTGRRPSGLCGAAIILAARMNNYRRTVREVVYTAKVCELTISKRLDEFKHTESSSLSVAEFRHHGLNLEKDHDPPAFYQQSLPKKRRKRDQGPDIEDEGSTSVSPAPEGALQSPSAAAQRAREDTMAMPPPPIPIDPALARATTGPLTGPAGSEDRDVGPDGVGPASTGEKRKRPRQPLPAPTPSQLSDETQIESEIDAALRDPEILANANEAHETYVMPPKSPSLVAEPEPVEESADPVSGDPRPLPEPGARGGNEARGTAEDRLSAIPDSEIIPPEEFADDPEVENCLLNDAERAIKERVWITENAAFLREQQARKIKKLLAEENGTAKTVVRRMRRSDRMGDMSKYWTVDAEGKVIGPQTVAEATKAMISKRKFSTKINYDRIDYLYTARSSTSGSRTESRSQSAAPTEASETDSRAPDSRATTPTAEVAEQASAATREPADGGRRRTANHVVEIVEDEPGDAAQNPIAIGDNGGDEDDDGEDDDADGDGYDELSVLDRRFDEARQGEGSEEEVGEDYDGEEYD